MPPPTGAYIEQIRAILEALKTAPEGEFVSVQGAGEDVRVAKEHGLMVVHVIDKENKQNVDVTIPWDVAQALISETGENQLNIEAVFLEQSRFLGQPERRECAAHDKSFTRSTLRARQ